MVEVHQTVGALAASRRLSGPRILVDGNALIPCGVHVTALRDNGLPSAHLRVKLGRLLRIQILQCLRPSDGEITVRDRTRTTSNEEVNFLSVSSPGWPVEFNVRPGLTETSPPPVEDRCGN